MPTAAANSDGSSDTLDICIFGMTSVCPGRNGRMSLGEVNPARSARVLVLTEHCYDILILVHFVSWSIALDYSTKSAMRIGLPGFMDLSIFMSFNQERSHVWLQRRMWFLAS